MLAWFGRRVPLEELRVACGVSRDGSKAANVIRAARTYGLEAKGFTREVEGVLAGPFPVVVFWGFNHFLVVEGVSAGKVHLNDPAVGPRTVTLKEFSDKFTGVVLEFDPGPDFVRGGAAPTLLSRLGRRLTGFEPSIAFVVWIGLMLVIPGLILPGMTADLRRQHPGRALRQLARPPADRACRHLRHAVPAVVDPGAGVAAHRAQAGARAVGPVHLARAAAAHRILQPALSRATW